MQQKIFRDLEKLKVKFSKIEADLKMPKNYLSRFKNQKNILPQKWVQPLLNYIQKTLNGTEIEKHESVQIVIKDFNYYLKQIKDLESEKESESFVSEINANTDLSSVEKRMLFDRIKSILPQEQLTNILQKTKLVVTETGLKEKPSDPVLDEIRKNNAAINKKFGEGTVYLLGDKPMVGIETISTGSITLDAALGIGGLPRGRIIEIYGLESSGKTTIALHVMANAQKKGLKCLLIDAENSFDPEYAASLGIDVDELGYCQPSCGDDGLQVADEQIATGKFGVVVIDSVAALVPKGELEGQMGESKMGLHARLMSQACRKMTSSISKTNTICIFINQLRNKIGMVWGVPEVTTGGLALQFYSSVRLEVRKMAQLKDGDISLGNRTKVKVAKNKCAPPFRNAEFDIIYGEGIDQVGEVIDIASEKNIIQKSGSWYSYNSDKLGQGRESVRKLLKDNFELFQEIKGKISL